LRHYCLPALLIVTTPAHAEDGLTLNANTRLRYETIQGQPRTGFNESDDLFNIRTIISGEYRTGEARSAQLRRLDRTSCPSGSIWRPSGSAARRLVIRQKDFDEKSRSQALPCQRAIHHKQMVD
jgi:hypothetical protein